MFNQQCPQKLYNCLQQTVSDTNNYNLRKSEKYVVPRTRLRLSEKSFIPSTVKLWNNLDRNVKNIPTLNNCESRIKGITVKPLEYFRGGF